MADTATKDPGEVINDMKDLKNQDSFTTISDAMQGSMVAAGVGLVGGLVIGYLKKYNLFMSGVIGMFGAGVIASIVLNKKVK